MIRPRRHREAEWAIFTQVVACELENSLWSSGALVLMRGSGPYVPAARLLLHLTSNPVPLTGGIVSSSTADGRYLDLQMIEGLGAAIILLVHKDLLSPVCVLEGWIGKIVWVSKDYGLRRLGRTLLVGLSCFVNSGEVEMWIAARSESRFRLWRYPPG